MEAGSGLEGQNVKLRTSIRERKRRDPWKTNVAGVFRVRAKGGRWGLAFLMLLCPHDPRGSTREIKHSGAMGNDRVGHVVKQKKDRETFQNLYYLDCASVEGGTFEDERRTNAAGKKRLRCGIIARRLFWVKRNLSTRRIWAIIHVGPPEVLGDQGRENESKNKL